MILLLNFLDQATAEGWVGNNGTQTLMFSKFEFFHNLDFVFVLAHHPQKQLVVKRQV
jgi:hypothetical protein